MAVVNKILVPIDFTSVADTAVEYTGSFCSDDFSFEVLLLHIYEKGTFNDEIVDKLNKAKSLFQSKSCAKCEVMHVEGDLIESTLQEQKNGAFDLIIMGTKGSHEDESVAFSNTSSLVQQADCPVLVVPTFVDPFRIKNIALALGVNEIDDPYSLGIFHSIARKFDASVHVLTIDSDDNFKAIPQNKNGEVLEYYLETLEYKYSFPKNSDIELGIAEYVKSKSIDLLAILPRNHTKKTAPSEGRLTKLLTLHTEVPLLTID